MHRYFMKYMRILRLHNDTACLSLINLAAFEQIRVLSSMRAAAVVCVYQTARSAVYVGKAVVGCLNAVIQTKSCATPEQNRNQQTTLTTRNRGLNSAHN